MSAEQGLAPPFSASDVSSGAEALAKAICWLSSTVQEERAARLAFESRVATKGTPRNEETCEDQVALRTELKSVPSDELLHRLETLGVSVADIDRAKTDQDPQKALIDLIVSTSGEDAPVVPDSITSVLTPEELKGLRDSIAAQVRASVLHELETSGAIAPPAQQNITKDGIIDQPIAQGDQEAQVFQGQHLEQDDPRLQVLMERLNMLDERVNGLASNPSVALIEKDASELQKPGIIGSRSLELEPSATDTLGDMSDTALIKSRDLVIDEPDLGDGSAKEVARRLELLEARLQELPQKFEARLQELPQKFEARLHELTQKFEARLRELPVVSSATSDEASRMGSKSRSDSRHRSKSAPHDPFELRGELMKFMEAQMADLKSATVTKAGAEDVVVESVGKLRLELTSLLHDQLDNLRSQVEYASQSSTDPVKVLDIPQGTEASSSATIARENAAPNSSNNNKTELAAPTTESERVELFEPSSRLALVEDAVTKAVNELRLDIGNWLEEQLGNYQVAPGGRRFSDCSTTPPPQQGQQDTQQAVTNTKQDTSTNVNVGTTRTAEAPRISVASTQTAPLTNTTGTSCINAPESQVVSSQSPSPAIPNSNVVIQGTQVAPLNSTEPSVANSNAATQAVGQVRDEIFNWLEEQLVNLREELARSRTTAVQELPLDHPAELAQSPPSISVAPPEQSVPPAPPSTTSRKSLQEHAHVPTDTSEQHNSPRHLAHRSSATEQQLTAPALAPSPSMSRRPSSARSKSTMDNDEENALLAPTVVPDSVYGSLEDVVKFFQGQLDDIRRMLVSNRAEAMKKASNMLRKEVRGWVDQELIEMQMRLKASMQATDENISGDTSSQLPPLKETSEEWWTTHLPEIVSRLCSDDNFNLVISKRCRDEVAGECVGMTRPASRERIAGALDGMIEGEKHGRPETQRLPTRSETQNLSLVGGLLGSGGTTIAKLESRLGDLERRVLTELEERRPSKTVSIVASHTPEYGSHQGDTSTVEAPPDFLSLMEVHDDLRRLKTRFEYLERMAPPEVQKALSFFEPLREEGGQTHDQEHQGSQASHLVGSAALMRRLQELHAAQDSELDEAKTTSEEARREVANLSRALKGVQRDGEVHGSKLLDIQKSLADQQKRLEVALPELLRSLEEILGSERQSGGEPDVAAGLRALLLPGGDSSKAESLTPFVSQHGLREALDALQGDVQAWLSQLRQDILNALRNKADTDMVGSIMERLEQVQSNAPVLQAPDQAHLENAALLRVPLLQGRCMSCDAQIGMKIVDESHNWPKQKQKPSPPWPQRGPNVPPSLAPVGAMRPIPNWPVVAGSQVPTHSESDIRALRGQSAGKMRRVESLPAIAPTTPESGKPLR